MPSCILANRACFLMFAVVRTCQWFSVAARFSFAGLRTLNQDAPQSIGTLTYIQSDADPRRLPPTSEREKEREKERLHERHRDTHAHTDSSGIFLLQ